MKTLLVLLFLFAAVAIRAQDNSAYQKHLFIRGGDSLPYRSLSPLNQTPGKKYPLVIFLHGAGERGQDNEAQLTHGAKLFLPDSVRKEYPAFVIFPQCSSDSYWSNVIIGRDSIWKTRSFYFLEKGAPTAAMKLLLKLVDSASRSTSVDPKHIVVAGLSMGGMGTFEIVKHRPKMFSKAISICGGANPKTARRLRKTEWRIYHGEKDDVVPAAFSSIMFTALKQRNADVQLKLYPQANHNSWDAAFAEPDFVSWIFE